METLEIVVNAITSVGAVGAAWICLWGFVGRLAGHTRGRPLAGAWLGLLFGPVGVAIAFRLAAPKAEPVTQRTTSADLGARLAQRAKMRPREETEMERFERITAPKRAAPPTPSAPIQLSPQTPQPTGRFKRR